MLNILFYLHMAAPSTDEIYETTLQTQNVVATGLVEASVGVEIDVPQRTIHGQASLRYISTVEGKFNLDFIVGYLSTDEGKFNLDLIEDYLTPRRVSLLT